jgi:glutamate carboxypeptidase
MSFITSNLSQSIIDYQTDHRQDFVDLLCDLVRIESPSLNPETQQPVLDLLDERFRQLGMKTVRAFGPRSGGHLLARATEKKGRPLQLLLGHCDTVWPLGTLEKMPLKVEKGWIHGPGVYDMKAGLAMIVFALQTLKSLGIEPALAPVALINSDEEVGSFESTSHIRRLARASRRAFVLEPSLGDEGKIKTARKGVGAFQVKVLGQAAHAGLEPDRGASAILELSYVIQQLFALSNPQTGTTVNVGMIDGGLRPNVVAPESQARVDVRVLSTEEGVRVEQAISQIKATTPGVEVSIKGRIGRPPLEATPRNRALWERAQTLGSTFGLELEEGTAGGASDGNTTSLFTATLDGLGAVGRGAHAADEAIDLERTLQRAALLTRLLLDGDLNHE